MSGPTPKVLVSVEQGIAQMLVVYKIRLVVVIYRQD